VVEVVEAEVVEEEVVVVETNNLQKPSTD